MPKEESISLVERCPSCAGESGTRVRLVALYIHSDNDSMSRVGSFCRSCGYTKLSAGVVKPNAPQGRVSLRDMVLFSEHEDEFIRVCASCGKDIGDQPASGHLRKKHPLLADLLLADDPVLEETKKDMDGIEKSVVSIRRKNPRVYQRIVQYIANTVVDADQYLLDAASGREKSTTDDKEVT